MHTSTMPYENTAIEFLMTRADACRLYSACFYPPDKEFFAREKLGERLGALLKTVCPRAGSLLPPLSRYIETEDTEALVVAYTLLFLGPPEVLAPPYASCYLDGERYVMGPSVVEIKKFYDSAGLGLDDDFNEMPDHVSAMLEFLYYLNFRISVAAAAGNPDENEAMAHLQSRFLEKFMKPWIPDFCEKIIKADRHPFYTGLAQSLEAFISDGFSGKRR